MGARLRSRWQNVRKLLEIFVVIVGCILVIALLVLIALTYIFNVPVPGLRGKTLWDWLQLLIIPLALAVIAILFNRSERKNEQRIASDDQQEAALQEFIKEMSALLLEKNLRNSDADAEVRTIARVRTLTVLPRLDSKRKRNLLLFLFDASLIDTGGKSINVSDADLSEADLSEVNLRRPKWIRDSSGKREGITTAQADLSGVNLRKANLNGAHLSGVRLGADSEATLINADLSGAVLGGVDLRRADLSGANLDGANLQHADLRQANLQGASLSIDSFLQGDEDQQEVSTWTGADLSGADLRGANLSGADLGHANLSGADLKGVTGITREELEKQAKLLKGAIMPDGSKHL